MVIPASRVENYLEPRFYRWAPKQLLQASPISAGHAHQNCAAAPLRLMLAQNKPSPSRTCQEYLYTDQNDQLTCQPPGHLSCAQAHLPFAEGLTA